MTKSLFKFLAIPIILLMGGNLVFSQPGCQFPPAGKVTDTSCVYLDAIVHWQSLVDKERSLPGISSVELQVLAGKCILTLLNNRQGPSGGLKHEGIYPSLTGFRGFWAWDSWKQAFALAGISPALAKNNIRAMFDYQDSAGMVADCIFADTAENNYRDTKPPLSAWAVAEIFHRTGDTAFVTEMFPKLLRYHQWWYSHRDHDRNGLCEYGSTDGTLQAARWESGWDNAARFDSARMVRNGENTWSMTQESCDLNSYLYAEKKFLSELASVLGQKELCVSLGNDAETLAGMVRNMMWDEETGFYYDIDLTTKKPIRVLEPNGWIPLWAGIPGKREAGRILAHIMDSTEFNTHTPFPTLAANDSRFNPEKGYWRGPVWIDQAYFGLNGLRRYGYDREADILAARLIRNSEGMLDPKTPLRENYNPLTGQGLNAEYFSWTSAHLLMILMEAGKP